MSRAFLYSETKAGPVWQRRDSILRPFFKDLWIKGTSATGTYMHRRRPSSV